MPNSVHDRLAGAILFVIALAWIVASYSAIPAGAGGMMLGPRAFPVAMGIALAFLSLLLVGRTFFRAQHQEGVDARATEPKAGARIEYWALAATFGFLAGHLLLMTWFGFVAGTALTTVAFLWLVLKQHSPVLLAGVPLGLAFGIWFVLGKLMGVYLPRGFLVDLF